MYLINKLVYREFIRFYDKYKKMNIDDFLRNLESDMNEYIDGKGGNHVEIFCECDNYLSTKYENICLKFCEKCKQFNMCFYKNGGDIHFTYTESAKSIYVYFYPTRALIDNKYIKISQNKITLHEGYAYGDDAKCTDIDIYNVDMLYSFLDSCIDIRHSHMKHTDYFKKIPKITVQKLLDSVNPNIVKKIEEIIIEI